MSLTQCQASFKNSRISPRAATTSADTGVVTVNLGPANTLIKAADSTRTYITIRNTSVGDDMRYGYVDRPTLGTDGFLLKAGESIDLESPGDIWAVGVGVAAVPVCWDQGNG